MATVSIPVVLGSYIRVNTDLDPADADDLFKVDDLKTAAESMLSVMKVRIFTRGQRANGTDLSAYSTKPINIPVKGIGTGNPLAKPKGGTLSKATTRKGVKHPAGQSMRFKQGYREFREKNGRGTRKNLTLSGNLIARFRAIRVTSNTVVLGWPGGSTQGFVASGLDAQEGFNVFTPSASEQRTLLETLAWCIAKRMHARGLGPDPGLLQLSKA